MIKNNVTQLLLFGVVLSMMFSSSSTQIASAVEGDLLLTINNPTPATNDLFGWSVATTSDGDLLVSVREANSNSTGTVYLFDGITGSLSLTINNPTPEAGDQFGISVATTDNDLLIGADQDNTNATSSGSAYLFDGTTGSLLLTLNNPTPESNDGFGVSVATTPNGDLLIGADQDNTNATSSGSAYLFDGTTGNLLLTINNPTPATQENFGISVATTSNGDLLIGADQDNSGPLARGSVYLFDGTTGSLLLTINSPTLDTDQFGFSVATTPDDNLLIGAFTEPTFGSVHLFDGITGSLLLTVSSPNPSDTDLFGHSVASTPTGNLLIGSIGDDTGASEAGSAHLFQGIITCDDLPATIVGTLGNDFIEGTSGDDVIVALDGDDFILGKGGNDTICGGDGNDLIKGNNGADTLFGDSGNDSLIGGNQDDVIFGGSGVDSVDGGSGDDTISGGSENDHLNGSGGIDIITGDAGNDRLIGGGNDDTLNGSGGIDICDNDGNDTVSSCELTN